MLSLRGALYLGAAGPAALMSPNVAAAQGATPVTQTSSATSSESGQVTDIIVTAQRRSESGQRVPVSVTAMDTVALERMGVRGTSDLGLVSPSVTFTNGVAGASLTIRGIGGTGSGSDEVVAGMYLDGVYLPSPASGILKLVNIDRIEVLKGPQGTLFGRNASSGAVQIITRAPTKTPYASFTAGYGNYDAVEFTGNVSGPLASNLFADVTGYYQKQSHGWGKNLFTGNPAYLGGSSIIRGKLRWLPTSSTDITLSGYYTKSRNPYVSGKGLLPGEVSLSGDRTLNFYDVNLDTDQRRKVIEKNVALTIAQDLGGVRLQSIASFDQLNQFSFFDNDASRLPAIILQFAKPGGQTNRTFSEELQLQSGASSAIKWVGGIYLFHNNNGFDPLYLTGTAAGAAGRVTTLAETIAKSYAAFGQATIPLGSLSHFTVGLRYSVDKRSFDISVINGTATPTVFPRRNATDKKLTWRFGIDRQFTPAVLTYLSYSRGFKSGLFNIGSATAPYVRPQTVDTFEAGLKSDLFNRHLRFNFAAFYNKFKDIQLRSFGSAGLPNFLNAAKAHTEGFEFDLVARPTPQFTLQGGATVLRGKYTRFPGAPFFKPKLTGGSTQFPGDASGNDTVNTPPVVLNAAATYEIPSSVGLFHVNASYQYNDGFFWDAQNRVRQPSYGLLNSEVGWVSDGGTVNARIWARNLTNSHYYGFVDSGTAGDIYQPSEPRTYGITLGWKLR